MNIRILLVDDHQMFREGLRAVLERTGNVQVVGEASDGRQAVAMVAGPTSPDIVIMDIGMQGLNGMDATRGILSSNDRVKVIALSAHSDRRFIDAMLEAGTRGYVLKESASKEIIRAVQIVHRGGKYLSPEVAGTVLDRYLGRTVTGDVKRSRRPLGAHKREVVQLLAEGKSSKEVARLLRISVKTVETHRRNIMEKLQLHSVAALTKFAIREGLTSTEA